MEISLWLKSKEEAVAKRTLKVANMVKISDGAWK